MTYAPRPSEFTDFVAAAPGCATVQRPAPRVGLWRRALNALFDGDQHQTEAEVARYLEHTGGRLTDDIERRITDRYTTGHWSTWR